MIQWSKEEVFERIDYIIQEWISTLQNSETFDMNHEKFEWFRVLGISLLESMWNENYLKRFSDSTKSCYWNSVEQWIWLLKALKVDIEKWWLVSMRWLISAEIFTDYLSMAEHLLEEKYQVAAAVIIGSTLEKHIRDLCLKNTINIYQEVNWKQELLKISNLNEQLYKNKYISPWDHKLNMGRFTIRNDAAHGNYENVKLEGVKIMLQSVQLFINKYEL